MLKWLLHTSSVRVKFLVNYLWWLYTTRLFCVYLLYIGSADSFARSIEKDAEKIMMRLQKLSMKFGSEPIVIVTEKESYMAKVEELIRIKEKQLEDKAAAKLHSFNGSCRVNDSATISSETSERTTSLRSNNMTTKGFAIGNGLTDPAIQYRAYTDFALDNKLINKTDYETINKMIPECEKDIELCATKGNDSCIDAYYACTGIFRSILDIAGNINYYDIRKQCKGQLCYDFSRMETFLSLPSVKEALGVHTDFVSCSRTVYDAMQGDWMKDLEVGIPALLEDGIKALIYAGEYDLICNWLGNSRWVHAMKWSGQKNFVGAPIVPFSVAGAEAGLMQSSGPLIFLKVHNAGHMVPMDQPKAALEMLARWTQGRLVMT